MWADLQKALAAKPAAPLPSGAVFQRSGMPEFYQVADTIFRRQIGAHAAALRSASFG